MKKAIHYINQFFAGVGGEDKADHEPEIRDGAVGPGTQLQKHLQDCEITHTLVCGDNYIGVNTDEAVARLLQFLEGKEFDVLLAGPAFRAGRYGFACGTICKAVKEKFGVPVITSMNEENPGVEMFKKDVYIFQGGKIAAKVRQDVKKMGQFANKLLYHATILPADKEGFFPRGIRHQYWLKPPVPAADRVVDMLLKKVNGEPFQTELPIPKADRVPIAPALQDLSQATVALVTSGGIVPVENPDRIQSASATRWGKYDIAQFDKLPSQAYQSDLDVPYKAFKTIHAGYDPAAADADPNVVVPLDAMRKYEKEGKIGKIYDFYYSTVGTGTTQGEAARMGQEIAAELLSAGVQAVILTST